MELQHITGLSASIIPHHQWPLRKWYYANPLWYYHGPGNDAEMVTGWKFYSLVDPDLRQVCHLLNTAGIVTTPSCQGHFWEPVRFEHTWSVLTREAMLIRTDGLIVKDSSTDREALFKEAGYTLPWESFDEYYAEAADHQPTGYLGILVPRERSGLAERFRRRYQTELSRLSEDQELGRRLGGEMFQLITHPRGPAERSEEWRKFTEWVRALLKEEPSGGSAVDREGDQLSLRQ